MGREQKAAFLFSPRNASLRLLEVRPHKRTFNPIGWALGSDTRTGTGGTGTGSWQRYRCQKMSTGGRGDLLPLTEPPHPPALPHRPAAPLQLEASLALLRVFMAFSPPFEIWALTTHRKEEKAPANSLISKSIWQGTINGFQSSGLQKKGGG